MSGITPKTIALEEFLKLPYIEESPAWEYVNGAVIQKAMGGGKHSTLQKHLVSAIDSAGSDYEAFPELRCSFGGRSVVPDVAIVLSSLVPVDESGNITSTGITFAPAWVIEVLSPDQSQTKVTGNILHCMRHGCRLGWLVDPDEQSVLIYHSHQLPELLSGASLLPVLKEIHLNLSSEQVFRWLSRRQKG